MALSCVVFAAKAVKAGVTCTSESSGAAINAGRSVLPFPGFRERAVEKQAFGVKWRAKCLLLSTHLFIVLPFILTVQELVLLK